MTDLTPIINALIAVVAALVSAFLIPWIKAKTNGAQRTELVAWAKIAVAAAEQLYNGQGRGDEKRQYVIDFLESKGFKIDGKSIINAIEAAVEQLNNEGLQIE